MKKAEQAPEISPQGTVAGGICLGVINGFVISIPVSAEVGNGQTTDSEAVTEQRDLPIIDTIDPSVLALSVPVSVVICGMLGAVKARVEQRGQSFFKAET